MAKIVELIYTEDRRGMGRDENDPCRLVKQWFEKDGTLVFEHDEWEEKKEHRRIVRDIERLSVMRDELLMWADHISRIRDNMTEGDKDALIKAISEMATTCVKALNS